MMMFSTDTLIRGALIAYVYEETPEWPRRDFMALRRLFDQGLSFTLMARRLGRNRNQVMGKVYRQGWERAGTRRAVIHRQQREPRKPPSAEAVALTLTPYIDHGLSLTDLKSCSCRYAIGEAADGFRFCGEKKRDGSPYCPDHHLRCYVERKTP
jgi:hypothetical protein